ncbi:MAG TPA: phosphomannomutase/phosphoglucomutase [Firmicutes bacterium]|nr:phosphomannomutase/phosphoglucomutase [Bacillota bacterium]
MVAVHPGVFREYDLRGLAATELTPDWVCAFGGALSRYFRRHGLTTVLVGRDNRLSSTPIRDALVAGLTAAGLDVVDIGTVTTPLFYFARIHLNIDAGVMITASHNPPEYNGFKIARGPATIYGEEIQELRRLFAAYIDQLQPAAARAGQPAPGAAPATAPGAAAHPTAPAPRPGTVRSVDVAPAYLAMLAGKIKLGPRRLKVAVDCGNGTTSFFAAEFLARLGCEVLPLYCESDPTFPHHAPDPVKSANLTDLRALVARSGADLGLGFDGDGDRLGVVDEQGNILWGDQLMILFWREILPRHPGATALVEVKCSQALVDEIRRLGGRPEFSRTGHSLIKARMREIGAVFTGEMSGHLFFADEYYGYDDAFYAAGRLLRILSHTERPLSALLADAPRYYSTAETRVPCPDEDKFRIVAELTRRFKERYNVVDVDGARVLFPEGWGLVRASNTQPVLVARCEGKTPAALAAICAAVQDALAAFPEVGEFEWEY